MQAAHRHWYWMLVVCGVALLARIGMLCWHRTELNQDVDAYLEIARHVAAGDGFLMGEPPHVTAYRPPFYPLLIAVVVSAGGYSLTLGVIHVAFGTVTTGLTLRLGQLLGLGRAANIAALLVAVDPLLLQYTSLLMTETLCAFLVAVWSWLILEFPARQNSDGTIRSWHPLLHGFCLGLICLCRPAFLAAVGLVGLWMVLQLARDWWAGCKRIRRTGQIGPIRPIHFICLAGLIVALSPWMVRNALVMGKATPATTHGGYTLLLANNPVFYREVVLQPWGTVWQGPSLHRWQVELEAQLLREGILPADEVSRDRWMYRQAWSHIRAEPGLFLRACLWRAVRFWDVAPWSTTQNHSPILIWGTAFFYGMVTVGILIGLYRLSAIEWKTWSILLLLPLTLWVTHWFYWTDMRMRAPVIPILALLAARAISRERARQHELTTDNRQPATTT